MSRRRLGQVVFVASLLGAMTAIAIAQTVYKWTDAAGVTHYSQQPPAAGKAKQLQLSGADRPAPAAAASVSAPPAPPTTALDAAKHDYPKLACANAQHNMTMLSNPILVLDSSTAATPPGVFGPKALTPDEREAAKLKAQQQIQQFCDRG